LLKRLLKLIGLIQKTNAIKNSNFFDKEWYLNTYPEVANSGMSPARHFLKMGAAKGFDPSPSFCTRQYLSDNPDVQKAGINPLVHFIAYGRAEGRNSISVPNPAHQTTSVAQANVAAEFDPTFYGDSNPDLVNCPELLDHFLNFGWKEGRDPNRNFSTIYYMHANTDVRDAGMNPFLHYVTSGRAEGRSAQPSQMVAAHFDDEPENPTPQTLKTGVILMIKNEIDIIRIFIEHALALFDTIVIVDHNSDDGTYETLSSISKITGRIVLFRLLETEYLQALTMNHIARTCERLDDVDWLFFLDADEFLPFETRESFHSALEKHSRSNVISMNWNNLVPQQYWDSESDENDEESFLISPSPSGFKKIAYQPKKLDRAKIWVAQGNHSVLKTKNGLEIASTTVNFPLLHIPVRSKNQLLFKLNQGVISYLRIGVDRNKVEGKHWFEIQKLIKDSIISNEILNAIVVNYGQSLEGFNPLTKLELKKMGFEDKVINIARQKIRIKFNRKGSFAERIFQMSAKAALFDQEDAKRNAVPITRLITNRNKTICRAPNDVGAQFGPLPDDAKKGPQKDAQSQEDASDLKFLNELIKPSYWEISDLTPSAWAGHIPFLFVLTTLERPRCYVELGSHFGASFFAFCQAAVRNGLDCNPVAIDSWTGDEHAGQYDENVFEQFKFILRKYDGFASYLRMYFNDAAKHFAEKSIDLLHIDGLHTYEAVREDYETWLPKMSDRGVILFHDINVHERDFGVWKLWDELRDRHPVMEFRHSHGLGIAYVGTQKNTRIERLIKLFNSDRWVRALLQQHFEEVSQRSVELFMTRFELEQREGQGQVVGSLNEEVSRLRLALNTSQAESLQLRTLLSGTQDLAAGK